MISTLLTLAPFSEADILATANKIKYNSKRPDGIPGFVFRGCISELVGPLSQIFNLSLQSGLFLTAWKRAIVFPAYIKAKAYLKKQQQN